MFFWNKKKSGESEKVVLAFGSFDLLHAGHENALRQAKALGDRLIVVLARDNTIRSVKGRDPVHNERQRLRNLRLTGWADEVMLGNHEDKHKIILKIAPQIIALGYDQFIFTQTLQSTLIKHQMNAEIVRLMPYFPQVYKSSLLRQKQEQKAQHEAQPSPALTPSTDNSMVTESSSVSH